MSSLWRRLLFCLILAVACSGCVAAALVGAGAGGYSYIKGELRSTYDMPIKALWPQTVSALNSLDLAVGSKHVDALGGKIEARRKDGTPVKVRFQAEGERVTTIGVRVGTFGSRKASEQVHHAIRKQIGI